jgi:hypothetical protein
VHILKADMTTLDFEVLQSSPTVGGEYLISVPSFSQFAIVNIVKSM